MRRFPLLPLLVCLAAAAASARVISYAPTSDRMAYPAVQHRMNRHFALVEVANQLSYRGQLVLYDSKGLEEPRVVYPASGTADILAAAAREDENGLVLFLQTSSTAAAMSADGGATWKPIALPTSNPLMNPWADYEDTGGPFVRGRYSHLLIGTSAMPFVFSANGNVNGVTADGAVKLLSSGTLIGTSRDGARFLVQTGNVFASVDADGSKRSLGVVAGSGSYTCDGWLTPDGGAYVELSDSYAAYTNYPPGYGPRIALYALSGSGAQKVTQSWLNFVTAPSVDYAGAWIAEREFKSTALHFHSPSKGLVTQWVDPAAPQIEALHAGASGKTVLLQVNRPRAALESALFKDPALAVWHIGQPKPDGYDELYLEETTAKAFVHLDVDAIESGEPFVFDSGIERPVFSGIIISPAPPSAGGGDVLQEWGVVRASLAQRLVLPGAARTGGAFGSFWTTDVTFYNPDDRPVNVSVRFAPNGGAVSAEGEQTKSVTLNAHEIRLVRDVLGTLFGLPAGNGALFITPDIGAAINVTSRTYTRAANGGTYGYGMNAVDVFAAASPRFPVTFAGAFPGASFRTNLAITDVSGRGASVALSAWTAAGKSNVSAQADAPLSGAQQVNFLGGAVGVAPGDAAALIVQPSRGEVVAGVFAIDNRTNDATYFPPDVPLALVRTIPAIVHSDGANGAKFRTDLYLFNNGDTTEYVTMQPRLWDGGWWTSNAVTLKPHELRVIPDILYTMWQKSGAARLRIWSQGPASDSSVRATSRTYTVADDGGTYGTLLPPLNSFQNATAGDTLEILGPVLYRTFRTNIGLVDLGQYGTSPLVRIDIFDHSGALIDSFQSAVPNNGGTQLNDVFHWRGLPDANTPVLIRITVLHGSIGAYAAMVDNATNDSAYFAANLGGKG